MSIHEIQWAQALQTYLNQFTPDPSEPNPDLQEETIRSVTPGLQPIASTIRPLPISSIQPGVRPALSEVAKPIAIAPIPNLSEVAIAPSVKAQFRTGTIERSVLTQLEPALLKNSQLAIQSQPKWQIAARQVYRQIPPVPIFDEPIRVGDFWLFPDSTQEFVNLEISPTQFQRLPQQFVKPLAVQTVQFDSQFVHLHKPFVLDRLPIKSAQVPVRRAFFASVPRWLRHFELTVHREQQGNSLRVAGGTAVLTVGVYPPEQAFNLEEYRLPWTDALSSAGYGMHLWRFLPISLQELEASLELEASHQQHHPRVSVSADEGTATFIIKLSSLGAQVWQHAIVSRQAHQISGICRFNTHYYARSGDRLLIRPQEVSTPLSTLIGGSGPEVLQWLDPTVAIQTKVLVEGSPILETVTLDWQPNTQDAPQQKTFGSQGGSLRGEVRSNHLNEVRVNWHAQVKYKMAGWSVISQKGELSAQSSAEIIKPSSSDWIREYTLFTVFMESRTQATQNPETFNDIELSATLTFSAPYLQLPLSTTFSPSHYNMTSVPFPLLPGQLPTQVGVAIATTSKSSGQLLHTLERILQPDDFLLNAKIHRDGHIELFTNTDPISESSIDAEIFELLAGTLP